MVISWIVAPFTLILKTLNTKLAEFRKDIIGVGVDNKVEYNRNELNKSKIDDNKVDDEVDNEIEKKG